MSTDASQGDAHIEIQRAKKIFYINLTLFCGILVIWIVSNLIGSEEQSAEDGSATTAGDLSLEEKAELLGETCGLGEHPKSLPPLERKWIVKYGRQVIQKSPEFKGLSESEQELLAEAFFVGYKRRYHEYYDGREAYAAGFKYAQKRYGQLPRNKEHPLEHYFLKHKAELIRSHGLKDKVSWIVFRIAFERGFKAGMKASYFESNSTAQSPGITVD